MKISFSKILLLGISVFVVTGVTTAKAQMACPGVDACTAAYVPGVAAYCGQNGQSCCPCSTSQENLVKELDKHRRGGEGKESYLFKTYWKNTVNPGLQSMLSKLGQTIIKQGTARGTFMDEQNNANSILSLQKGAAEAARNYAPSEALCRFGTLAQGLSADESKARNVQIAITGYGLGREIGARGSIAQTGAASDRMARMNEFVKEYCNPGDNNNGLALMCGTDPQRTFEDVPRDQRINRDIDYTGTIDMNDTIDLEMAGAAVRPGEQDVLSLGQNLYGNKQMSARQTEGALDSNAGQSLYLKMRSITGARNVALNSYGAIAAQKSKGSGSTLDYMKAMYRQLGLSDQQATADLGDKPSYYAQMDILTKKLYQNPAFYVNLMEGKSNVARQSGAMEGLELIQDRDIYNSMKRSEMLLALMVQLEARRVLSKTAQDVNAPQGRRK